MAIGKGNGRHWIKATPRTGAPLEEPVSAVKLAQAAHQKHRTPRVARTIKGAGK